MADISSEIDIEIDGEIEVAAHTLERYTKKNVGNLDNVQSSGLMDTLQGHVSDMRILIQCSICTMPMHEPFTIACGHTFCYSCLSSWFTNSGQTKKTCPECRGPVRIAPAPSYIVRTLVQMFTSRAELLDKGETTTTYAKHREEAIQELESDKANADPLSGGLFKGLFRDSPLRPTVDIADGVARCPMCHWEIENNMDCVSCGYIFGQDSDASDGESPFSFASFSEPEDDEPVRGHPVMTYHDHETSEVDDSGNDEDENDYDENDSFIDDEDQPIATAAHRSARERHRAELHALNAGDHIPNNSDGPGTTPDDSDYEPGGTIVRNFGSYYYRTRQQGEWHYRSLAPRERPRHVIQISSDYSDDDYDDDVIETGSRRTIPIAHIQERSEDEGVYAEAYDSVDSEESDSEAEAHGSEEDFIEDDEGDDHRTSLPMTSTRSTATAIIPFPGAITINVSDSIDESDDEPVGPMRRAPQGRLYRFSPY
ncbi:hypothetical protein N7495_000424 [Penicillium taxi]|uniref:uncharacterized protein n=1 Tax=Penicillium taxi TaxID=168475 RepID=UPI00254550D3|nr:uncharacterized protein N7495_000424 [Penicillium taxi]KAJ5907742.1 hypothetical protein N7495_000424 [Penicillium taxi]